MENMKYKIIFFDLDGTLLNSESKVSQKNINAIKKLIQSGYHAVPASGRADIAMTEIAKELGLYESGGYILSYNGGKIVKLPEEEVVFTKTIDNKTAQKAYDRAISLGLAPLIVDKVGIIASNVNSKTVQHEQKITGLPLKEFDGNFDNLDIPINKILATGEEEKVLAAEKIMREELGEEISAFRSQPIFLELMPKNINKSVGMLELLKVLDIKPEEAIACGDGENDIEMLQMAGLGLAMENAEQAIKDIANGVIPSNEEDGVAYAIEKYFV